MANSIYQINKAINQPIEFKGLKAQYIGYLGVGLVFLLILFAAMYILGIASLLCIGITLSLGSLFVVKVYHLSNKYGAHGVMKAFAAKKIPKVIRCTSRKVFFEYKN